MNLNKAQLIGRVTRDPELKALPSGQKVVTFGIATNRSWKDKEVVKQESVEFHNCTAFGKGAELLAQYVKKGNLLYVEGYLKTNTWEDKETQKKMYRTEIIVENFQFAPKGANESSGTYGDYDKKPAQATKSFQKKIVGKKQSDENVDTIEYPTEEINPEDIPF